MATNEAFTLSMESFEGGITATDIAAHAANANGSLNVDLPLRCVGITQDPWDIASDYVDVAFFGEKLSPLTSSISIEHQFDRATASILFRMQLADLAEACDLIYKIVEGVFVAGDDPDICDQLSNFEEELYWQSPKRVLNFPELADDYMANLLHASFPWEDPRNRRKYRKKFPETKFGFWRSFISPTIGFDLFVSTQSWVAPLSANTGELLSHYGFAGPRPEILFEPAQLIQLSNQEPLLISDSHASVLPLGDIRGDMVNSCGWSLLS